MRVSDFKSEEQLKKMSVADIKKHIREFNDHYGIKGYSKLKKDQMINQVLTAQMRIRNSKTAPATAKKAQPAKKAPAPPKKDAGFTIKEVKNDKQLKEVVKQYIKNWVSRPRQQREYNKRKTDEAKIKDITIDSIFSTTDIIIKGEKGPFDKEDTFQASKKAKDIEFELEKIGKKIEPNFEDTEMTIYKQGRQDANYPIFVQYPNPGNKILDDKFATVEEAEKDGLKAGIKFARENDPEAFANRRAESQAFRKNKKK